MITVELTEKEIKDVLISHINNKLGDFAIAPNDIKILVKSKQNYKSEWEEAGVVATSRTEKYIPEIKAEAVIR